MPGNDFFRELKRRNVYKVAITYGVVAWLLAQVVSLACNTFNAPAWVMQMVFVILIIGFPIALVLACAFEMSPQGVRRTNYATDEDKATLEAKNKRSFLNPIIGILLVIILAQFVYIKIYKGQDSVFGSFKSSQNSVASQLENKRVAIMIFENQTFSEKLEPFGIMISDWITQGLKETGAVDVVSASNVRFHSGRTSMSNLANPEFAETTGAGALIQGRYYLQENELIVVGNVVDALNGEVLFADLKVRGNQDDMMRILDELTQKVLGFWVLSKHKRFETKPPKYDAYQAYVLAEESRSSEKAEELLKRSFELDSSFYTPVLKMIVLYRNQNKYYLADSVINLINERNPSLTQWEEYRFQALQAIQNGDYGRSAEIYDRMHSAYPTDALSFNMAVNSYNLSNRPHRAIEFMDTNYGPENEAWRSTVLPFYKMESYFFIGDYYSTCRYAMELNEPYENIGNFLSNLHIKALARLDSLSKIDYYLDYYESNGDKTRLNPPRIWWNLFFELKLKGNDEQLNKYVSQYLSKTENYKDLPDYKLMKAFAHFYLKEYKEALIYLPKPDMFQHTTDSDYEIISLRAVCHASLDHAEEAEKIIEYLESMDNPYDYGKKHYYKAQVEAALNLKDQAVASLEEAIKRGFGFDYWSFKNDVLLIPLFGYPPFEELVKPIE